MKKIISLLTLAAFLAVSGLAVAQTQEAKKVTKEAKTQTKAPKKSEKAHKTVKKEQKSCDDCTDKTKCADEKSAETK
jgi:hypothetical protein